MRAKPHDGVGGVDCQQCGQGIAWKRHAAFLRAAKRKSAKAKR